MTHKSENWRKIGRITAGLIITWSLNGMADDCDFIRAELGNTAVKNVVIPAGIYTCNQPIVMNRSGQRLSGQGQVTIRLADHANCPLLIMGKIETPPEATFDLEVGGIIFDGNRLNQDMECWGGPCDSGGTTYIRNNGITVRRVIGAEINKVEVNNMRSGGLVPEKNCEGLNVNGLVARNNHFDGVAAYLTTKSTFENLLLADNLGAGISLDIGFNRNVIRNFRLIDNKDVGIFMRDSRMNIFKSGVIENLGNHAIFIAQDNDRADTCPKHIIIEDTSIDGAKGDGVHVASRGCRDIHLVNVQIKNVTGKKIYEVSPGQVTVSTRNTCLAFLQYHADEVYMKAGRGAVRGSALRSY